MSFNKILTFPVKENYENCEHNDLQIEISEVIVHYHLLDVRLQLNSK